jgi:hypothetical protein
MTADVLRTPRRGTPSSTRNQRTCTRRRHEKPCPRSGDASFTRSEDPCTSILTMHRAQARWWGAGGDIAVGQTCASGRNQHRGHRKRTERGSPRVIAPAREAAWHVRKGRRSRPPSLRGSRVRVWLLARRCMLQKSAGDVWSRISSANALQKERSGSSERGPSSERRSAGETVGRRAARNVRRESSSPLRRERIGARLRVARDRHPAVHPSS